MDPEILVVDDDNAIRETLCLVLEDEGYTVADAADGHAALRILRSTPYPLVVLLDQCMPVLDGAGVLRAAAADRALAHGHSFILLTASAGALEGSEREFGPLLAGVVAKPFDLDTLLDTVARVVTARRYCALTSMDGGDQPQFGAGT